MFEISQTDEWRDILSIMRSRLEDFEVRITDAAGTKDEPTIKKIWGQYDGFRQAVEYLTSLGSQKEKD